MGINYIKTYINEEEKIFNQSSGSRSSSARSFKSSLKSSRRWAKRPDYGPPQNPKRINVFGGTHEKFATSVPLIMANRDKKRRNSPKTSTDDDLFLSYRGSSQKDSMQTSVIRFHKARTQNMNSHAGSRNSSIADACQNIEQQS